MPLSAQLLSELEDGLSDATLVSLQLVKKMLDHEMARRVKLLLNAQSAIHLLTNRETFWIKHALCKSHLDQARKLQYTLADHQQQVDVATVNNNLPLVPVREDLCIVVLGKLAIVLDDLLNTP